MTNSASQAYFDALVDNLQPSPGACPVEAMLSFEDACAEDKSLPYAAFWDFVEWMLNNRSEVLRRISDRLNASPVHQ